MRTKYKKVFKIVGIVFLVITIGIGFLGYKISKEFKKMQTIETKEVISGIYAINEKFVNFFLVKDSLGYVAIDAGQDIEKIKTELIKLSINPDSVHTVLLTHSDDDHVGGLKLFKNASVYISENEIPMLTGNQRKFWFGKNSLGIDKYSLITANQILNAGNTKVKCIETYGHTSGSMSFLINDSCLFVGDAMILSNGKIADPIGFFTMDKKQANNSIKNITNLQGVSYIFTAHSGYSSDYNYAVSNWE